jgi:hypothetical protein
MRLVLRPLKDEAERGGGDLGCEKYLCWCFVVQDSSRSIVKKILHGLEFMDADVIQWDTFLLRGPSGGKNCRTSPLVCSFSPRSHEW